MQAGLESAHNKQLFSKPYAYHNLKHQAEISMTVPEFKENIAINNVHKFPAIIQIGEEEGAQSKCLSETVVGRKGVLRG